MKRLLLVLATSAALSAYGQAGQHSPFDAIGSSQKATVIVKDWNGQPHALQVPFANEKLRDVLETLEAMEIAAGGQAGCPVQVLAASFERPAQLMPTAAQVRADGAPTLRLNYRNLSGKDIESVRLTGYVKVKDNPYQLDSVTRPFDVVLSRKALLGKDVQATQALKLAANAIGLDRIELSRVTYADGTSWQPERRNCVFSNAGGMERAEAR